MKADPGDPAASAAGGLLPVDKPAGPTSHDVVGLARRALGERRIGHAGTLDPFATGLLLLLVGPATRLSEYLTGLGKRYEATARLGIRTDTLDPEGEVVAEDRDWRELTREDVRTALASLEGRALQRPPDYSAKKVGGEAAHRRVRRGERVELDPVEVEIRETELLEADLPELRFRLACSSGTYVRAIARDLGARLGTAAHLTQLRRLSIGPFRVEDAIPGRLLDEGDDAFEGALPGAWVPASEALPHLPRISVGDEEERALGHGRPVEADALLVEAGRELPEGGAVSLVREGRLVAVGERSGPVIRPRKVFVRA